jgi:hypothetical protein
LAITANAKFESGPEIAIIDLSLGPRCGQVLPGLINLNGIIETAQIAAKTSQPFVITSRISITIIPENQICDLTSAKNFLATILCTKSWTKIDIATRIKTKIKFADQLLSVAGPENLYAKPNAKATIIAIESLISVLLVAIS